MRGFILAVLLRIIASTDGLANAFCFEEAGAMYGIRGNSKRLNELEDSDKGWLLATDFEQENKRTVQPPSNATSG